MRVDPAHAFASAVKRAMAASEGAQFEEAAEHWVHAAKVSASAGSIDSERQAWAAAGECLRRADRPRAACDALKHGLGVKGPPSEHALLSIRHASVLGTLGRGQDAAESLERARKLISHEQEPLWADTAIGHELTFGRKAVAKRLVPKLAASPAALQFRRGQLARMDGDLQAAREAFLTVEEALAGVDGAGAGVAGAQAERALVEVFAGQTAEAAEALERGREGHEAAGRRGLAIRCEAGRVRAMVLGGLPVVRHGLQAGLGWALERSMLPLSVELRIVLGMAEQDRSELRLAARLANTMGARILEGRARLRLAEVSEDASEARLAVELLEDHVLLRERAEALASA